MFAMVGNKQRQRQRITVGGRRRLFECLYKARLSAVSKITICQMGSRYLALKSAIQLIVVANQEANWVYLPRATYFEAVIRFYVFLCKRSLIATSAQFLHVLSEPPEIL